jgi:hypothetical protein
MLESDRQDYELMAAAARKKAAAKKRNNNNNNGSNNAQQQKQRRHETEERRGGGGFSKRLFGKLVRLISVKGEDGISLSFQVLRFISGIKCQVNFGVYIIIS